MFGLFKKKKLAAGFKELPEVRDRLKNLAGEAMNVYVGTLVGHFLDFGKTSDDVDRAKTMMLEALQRYVRAEILLDGQSHGREPELLELAGLVPGRIS